MQAESEREHDVGGGRQRERPAPSTGHPADRGVVDAAEQHAERAARVPAGRHARSAGVRELRLAAEGVARVREPAGLAWKSAVKIGAAGLPRRS
jgi:hypothetical protein